MLKVQLFGSIAQKCLVLPLFNSRTNVSRNFRQINLISSTSLPEKFNENEHRSKVKPRFKEKTPFRHHVTSSFDDDPWEKSLKSISNESEQEFLVRIKNNPDTFGDSTLEPEYLDEGDVREEKYSTEQPSPHKKLSTKKYADIIKGYIQQRKIKEAIDVIEIKMIQEDRAKPENYIYNLVLGACGRVGYTKKAFMLYNDMKKRGLKVTGGTYTALFNACANSPWPTTDGLTRAKALYNIMIEKGDQPNDTNYNAMIKAFGRCGDMPMAFSLVDEMTQKGFLIRDDTISFLLQACIGDQDAGFRHALLVWRKLTEKNIKPSIYTFNLLLRCVRDCGLGDIEVTKDVIKKLVGEEITSATLPDLNMLRLAEGDSKKDTDGFEDVITQQRIIDSQITGDQIPLQTSVVKLGETSTNQTDLVKKVSSIKSIENLDFRPNLLARKPHLGNILSISEVKRPEDRLLLLGGCKGFLETVSTYKCTPDIKTFTQLLDCIPSTLAAEKELIVVMKKLNVQADVDFYNMLIKKRSMRFDYEAAREVLTTMKQMKLLPDLITYGVLSLSCSTKEQATDLVNQIKASKYPLNAVILGAMLKQGCHHMRFDYIFEIMELCLKESVPANKKFLEHLESFKEKCNAKLDAKKLNKTQVKLFGIFKARHKTWLTEVQIDDTEQAHPWQQYRQNYPEDVKFKPKDTARFKARHASLFKVKTSTKRRY